MTNHVRLCFAGLLLLLPALAPAAASQPIRQDRQLAAQPPELPPSTPEARVAMQGFGRCVADHFAEEATQMLAMDFTTPAYRERLQHLVRANRACLRGGRMQGNNLAFAGAVAEELMLLDPTPLVDRLTRASLAPGFAGFTDSDGIAICVVRSVPDEVATLLESGIASPEEAAAFEALAPTLEDCNETGRQFETNAAALRPLLATAAFRSLRAAGQPDE